MPGEVASATTRKSRVLLTVMEALGCIPDLLTIHYLEELLVVVPQAREGLSLLLVSAPAAALTPSGSV